MQMLLDKLDKLEEETGEGRQTSTASKAGTDEFKRLKTQIAGNVREIRGQLKQRDELLQKGAVGTKGTVQISHNIRSLVKAAREDANKLMALQQKEAAKSGKAKAGPSGQTQAEERREVVELVFKHVEECEALEKRRYASIPARNFPRSTCTTAFAIVRLPCRPPTTRCPGTPRRTPMRALTSSAAGGAAAW